MLRMHTWLCASLSLVAPFVLSAESALAQTCPPAGPLKVCPGRQIGDLLIVSHGYPYHVTGLHPATRVYYDFSADPVGVNTSEWGQIVAEPANPVRTLVIGDMDNFGIGIREFDECGAVTSTNPVWGTFGNLPPHATLGGTNNRGLAANPLNGNMVSPGDFGDLLIFSPSGGQDTWIPMTSQAVTTYGNVAFDPLGNFFAPSASDGSILRYPAATLSSPPVVGTSLPGTAGLIQSLRAMVSDANGHLFVTGTAGLNGQVWKVDMNAIPPTTTLLTSNMGPLFGFAPMKQARGITMDASGALWVVLYDTSVGTFAGVAEINTASGQVVDFFPPTAGSPPTPLSDPDSIAVYGVNLPAIQAVCPPRTACDVNGIHAGACLGAGVIDPTTGVCLAPAGVPSNDWHTQPSPNGSWDWNCDGVESHQYNNLNTIYPRNVCQGTATTCNGSLDVFSEANPACGTTFTETQDTCRWTPLSHPPRVGQGCTSLPFSQSVDDVQQGCR